VWPRNYPWPRQTSVCVCM